MPATLEPVRLQSGQPFGHPPRMAEGDDAILASVDDEHVAPETGESGPVRLGPCGEVVLYRPEQREVGRTALERAAGGELVVDEEPDLRGIRVREASLEALGAEPARDHAGEELAHPGQRQRAIDPRGAEIEAGHGGAEQGQPLHSPRVIEGVPGRHRAAQGMADEANLLDTEGAEQSFESTGEEGRGVRPVRLARAAEAREVEGDDAAVAGEFGDVVTP